MLRVFLTVGCSILLTCGAAQAFQIYTWVDENGQKHFSQTPPKNSPSQAEKLVVKTPQSTGSSISDQEKEKELNALADKVDESNEARKEADEEAGNTGRNQKLTQEACKQATTRLQALRNTPRLYTKKDNGEYHWYTDEEKKDLISQATQEAKEFCKPK